jgi:hypothetical protein
LIRATLLPDVAFPQAALTARLVAFTAVAAVLAGVASGLGPAVQASRADLAGDLAAGAKGSARRSRVRSTLTALQAALSMVLLIGAGLFVRSVGEVRRQDLGLDVDRLVLAQLEFDDASIPGSSADGPPSPEATRVRNELYVTALARAARGAGRGIGCRDRLPVPVGARKPSRRARLGLHPPHAGRRSVPARRHGGLFRDRRASDHPRSRGHGHR